MSSSSRSSIRTLGSAKRTAICAIFLASAATSHAATITVNSTADIAVNDGQCTLREAIISANTNAVSGAVPGECGAGTAGLDTIAFAIPGLGLHTIVLTSSLPPITEAAFINGYSQSGATPNSNALNAGINAVLLIEINGDVGGGLVINAPASTVRGLCIHSVLSYAVTVNAGNVTIAGNFFGTNPAGTALASVSELGGVRLNSGDNNVIGGPAPGDRNLISTNGLSKVFVIDGNSALIQGNYVGTDVTGTTAFDLNEFNFFPHTGIEIHNPAANTSILGNLISGNSGGGIDMELLQFPGGGGVILGNLIGTQRDGVSALGNLDNGGVSIAVNGVSVGGTAVGEGNTIAFNVGGVAINPNAVGNRILGNSIFSNGNGLGIRLLSGTPLPNDPCDADVLPGNQGQNYPVITSAPIVAGNVTIFGTLNSTANTSYRVEFFSNAVAHSSGNGEGKTFIGFATVTTDGTCNATFGPLVFAVPAGQTIFSATATDPTNNTSEFAVAFPIGAPPSTPTPPATATATPTSTPVGASTATPTPGPAGGGTAVPTLSPGLLAFFGLALVLAAVFLLKKTG